MLSRIKDAGFDAVEMYIPKTRKDQAALSRWLDKLDLRLIVHQFEAYGNCADEYIPSFEHSLLRAAPYEPLLINSHTGKDYWSFRDNKQIFEAGEEVHQKTGIMIVHETHRERALYSGPVARKFMKKLPFLKLNADFSHWVNVSESLMKGQESTMKLAIDRTEYVHARVGHAQGPQVTDPRAPEWKTELDVFTDWWAEIVRQAMQRGRESIIITPEFGPPPYTAYVPYTNQWVSDPWEINCDMKGYLKEKLESLLSRKKTKPKKSSS
jgi:hypothetical protein